MTSADGWRVEPVTIDRGDGPRPGYRVTRWGVYVGTYPDLTGVEGAGVEFEGLSEEDSGSSQSSNSRSSVQSSAIGSHVPRSQRST
jgi:hypothetical protein